MATSSSQVGINEGRPSVDTSSSHGGESMGWPQRATPTIQLPPLFIWPQIYADNTDTDKDQNLPQRWSFALVLIRVISVNLWPIKERGQARFLTHQDFKKSNTNGTAILGVSSWGM